MNKTEIGLEVWKATLAAQQHFNELGIKLRSIAITILAAFIAVAGYAIKEGDKTLAGLILFASLVCWISFYLMDRLWYHILLRASVRHGEKIEAALKAEIPYIDLTTCITKASPIIGLSAGERLTIFYGSIAVVQSVSAGILLKGNGAYYLLLMSFISLVIILRALFWLWQRRKARLALKI